MIKTILLASTIWLVGCAANQPLESPAKVEIVKVPVSLPCVQNLPVKPIFIKDSELIALNESAFVTALHIDRLLRDAYISKLEAAYAGCN